MTDRIHPDGWAFICIFSVVTMILMSVHDALGYIGIALTVWCAYFFRIPPRVGPKHDNWIISPADGKVVLVESVTPPENLEMGDEPLWRVSIFLNVFDVHVNYMPFSGTVERVLYHPGQFFNASLDKASELNERNSIVIETESGDKMAAVQIAGLIARRIRCDVKAGDHKQRSDVWGLIRFGSRVDLYLPKGIEPLVSVGQRMIGGETLIAYANK